MNPGCLQEVRRTAAFVSSQASHVRIDRAALQAAVTGISQQTFVSLTRKAFDPEIHYLGKEEATTAQYLLVLDALNFCFWPEEELEYEHLARGLKETVTRHPDCISADCLSSIDEEGVISLIGRPLPLLSERARLLREVGQVLQTLHMGQASNLIRHAHGSAEQLVNLMTTQFRGFQDHAIYRGHQVFFYKRAQIFVGDVWGAFQGQGLGAFCDIHQLTMFADYRVPVVLRELGILEYSEALASKVQSKEQLLSGCEAEAEIRACSITAVEGLRAELSRKFEGDVHNVQIDWWLWEQGEQMRKEHPPHHRTLTTYY